MPTMVAIMVTIMAVAMVITMAVTVAMMIVATIVVLAQPANGHIDLVGETAQNKLLVAGVGPFDFAVALISIPTLGENGRCNESEESEGHGEAGFHGY
jgi:hypothetical protein